MAPEISAEVWGATLRSTAGSVARLKPKLQSARNFLITARVAARGPSISPPDLSAQATMNVADRGVR
jgi:hypothetical protein